MRELLEVLFVGGATVYGGSLTAFALLLAARRQVEGLRPEDVVRVWKAWGPGLGLSMGALILGGVGGWWMDHGEFRWGGQPTLVIAQHILFFVLWLSSFHAEIWTLEPCRKLDVKGEISDPVAFEAAASRVTGQTLFNAALFLGCLVLGVLSSRG